MKVKKKKNSFEKFPKFMNSILHFVEVVISQNNRRALSVLYFTTSLQFALIYNIHERDEEKLVK